MTNWHFTNSEKLNMTNKVCLYYLMSHIVLFSEFNSVSMLPITLYCPCLVCQVCNIGVSSPESAHSLTSHQPTDTQPLLFVGSLYIRKCKQTIILFRKSCGIVCVLIARAIMLLSMLHILNILSTWVTAATELYILDIYYIFYFPTK